MATLTVLPPAYHGVDVAQDALQFLSQAQVRRGGWTASRLRTSTLDEEEHRQERRSKDHGDQNEKPQSFFGPVSGWRRCTSHQSPLLYANFSTAEQPLQ